MTKQEVLAKYPSAYCMFIDSPKKYKIVLRLGPNDKRVYGSKKWYNTVDEAWAAVGDMVRPIKVKQ